MLLKSISIQGFKSFADKTKLNFGDGITAVVGPNGSGKSNISDAVRWVLGEQSTKSLRGSSMEDVIFIGSESRRPQGFAEVTLTIDNTDRSLNFDNDTVSVTRRYYRSHESEYLINGVSVRLKDVNELFMDTGLGRDGYSMIGQGKIDSIVGAKPNERRDIFEEASGISRYRYRKTEAERKLLQAEENMVRLNDIFSELENRITPLKKQSEKAQTYLSLREERKNLEIGLWLNSLDSSKDALRNHDRKITLAKTQYEDINKQLADIEKEHETFNEKNAFFLSAIEQKRQNAASSEESVARTEGEIAVCENSLLHNNQNLERIKFEAEGLKGSDESVKEKIQNEYRKLDIKNTELQQNNAEILKTNENLNSLTAKSEGFSKQIEQMALRLNEIATNSADLQVKLVSAKAALGEIDTRREAIKQNKAEIAEILEEQNKEFENLKIDRTELEDTLETLRNTLNGYKMKAESKENAVKETEKQIEELRQSVLDISHCVQILKELEDSMEGFNSAVKAVVKSGKSGELKGILGPIIRLIKTDKENTVAIETALGNATQNIVTETESDAKFAINMLKSEKKGRATFLPVSTIKGRRVNSEDFEKYYGFVGVACDLVSADDKYREIIVSLLGRILVAEDLDAATVIAKKTDYKYKIVTLDGQLVHAGGSMTGGSLSLKAGLLSRSGEISALREKGEKKEQSLKAKEQELSLKRESADKVKRDISATEAEISAANEDLIRVLGELRRVGELVNTSKQNISLLDKEENDCTLRYKENEEIIANSTKNISEVESEQADIKAEIDVASGGRDSLSKEREELTATLTALKLKDIEISKDIEAISSSAKQLENTLSDRKDRLEQLLLQEEQILEANRALSEAIEGHKAEIERLKLCAETALKEAEELRLIREDTEKHSVEMRQKEKTLQEDKEKLGGELIRLDERRGAMLKEYDDIVRKLFDEYELTRSEAEELNIVIENPAESKRQLSEIKGKMKALGDVNVSAIEEYKEVKERYEYYKVQIEDVQKSSRELNKLISDLTGTMKELFEDGFEKINRNFQKTFTDLFGGGSAQLLLSDPENILESGIDISVRIPGKTVSKIEPLSGGEKALVAISLYFAIMMVNPPPFCLLDEVESALDEVNVDRVAEYMHSMNASTQFICITHRRGTMEAADMLYGVTMQEKGVSKLLELNVSELEKQLGIEVNA